MKEERNKNKNSKKKNIKAVQKGRKTGDKTAISLLPKAVSKAPGGEMHPQ